MHATQRLTVRLRSARGILQARPAAPSPLAACIMRLPRVVAIHIDIGPLLDIALVDGQCSIPLCAAPSV